ncbi:hypothetical protein [Actinomadura atramentaria]|uniref:hypothetical protein n=1 Tax=Actinomadura atramentaria TaxID=1990 RepID=UPI00037B83BB|nr:hypothetical protein [Actinomadura atramentaria]
MRGDTIEMTVDNGTGVPAIYRVTATRSGRRVELDTDRTMVTMREVRRDGTAVDTMRFPLDRIIAIHEYRMTNPVPPPRPSTGGTAPLDGAVPPTAKPSDRPRAGGLAPGSSRTAVPNSVSISPVAGEAGTHEADSTEPPSQPNRRGKPRKPGKRKR